MGDAGIGGGGNNSTQSDFAGINSDIGMDFDGMNPANAGTNLSISKASVEAQSAQEGGMSHDAMFGTGESEPEGPDYKKPAEFPKSPPPPPVEEKKEGVKRKARKRSLLNDEEKTVYRRSILGG